MWRQAAKEQGFELHVVSFRKEIAAIFRQGVGMD